MGNLTETEQWEDDIYQLETSDPVLGGPEGISNKAPRQLANRTRWLKKGIEQASQALDEHVQSRDHPDGTLTAKGFIQLSNAVNSDSELLAPTLKALKIAMDNANARLAKERNGADIPNVRLFVTNLGLDKAVGQAANALPLTGGTLTGDLKVNANVAQVDHPDAFRIVYGQYGTFWRNDGRTLYLMLTDAGDRLGSYNSLRPLAVNLLNGDITLGKAQLTDYTYFYQRFDTRYVNQRAGDIGSLCFARLNPQNRVLGYGDSVPGGDLSPGGATAYPGPGGGDWVALSGTGSLAGTWRCLGYAVNDTDGRNRHYSLSLYVRIA